MLEALPEAGASRWRRQAYDTAAFVASSRAAGVTPHVAQNINTHRAQHRQATMRHAATGSASHSQADRGGNGWIKQVGGMRKPSCAVWSGSSARLCSSRAYNLIRLHGCSHRMSWSGICPSRVSRLAHHKPLISPNRNHIPQRTRPDGRGGWLDRPGAATRSAMGANVPRNGGRVRIRLMI